MDFLTTKLYRIVRSSVAQFGIPFETYLVFDDYRGKTLIVKLPLLLDEPIVIPITQLAMTVSDSEFLQVIRDTIQNHIRQIRIPQINDNIVLSEN